MPPNSPDSRRGLLKKRTKHSRWLVLALIPVLAVSAPPLDRPEWMRELLEVAGVVGLVVCLTGRVWSAIYVAGRKNQQLVTVGPYAMVRNPLYVFSFIGLVGVGLVSERVTVLVVAAIVFMVYYRQVVRREESHLAALHGDAFRSYAAAVPRWIPDFSAWRDVAELTIRPPVIAAHLRDSSVFFISFLFFEGCEFLQDRGLIPVLFRLP